MVAYPRTCCTASSPLALDPLEGLSFATKTFVNEIDLKAGGVDPARLETADRSKWRLVVKAGVQTSEKRREDQWEEKRERRRQRAASAPTEPRATVGADYTCSNCNRACRSRIGLYRRCNSTTD